MATSPYSFTSSPITMLPFDGNLSGGSMAMPSASLLGDAPVGTNPKNGVADFIPRPPGQTFGGLPSSTTGPTNDLAGTQTAGAQTFGAMPSFDPKTGPIDFNEVAMHLAGGPFGPVPSRPSPFGAMPGGGVAPPTQPGAVGNPGSGSGVGSIPANPPAPNVGQPGSAQGAALDTGSYGAPGGSQLFGSLPNADLTQGGSGWGLPSSGGVPGMDGSYGLNLSQYMNPVNLTQYLNSGQGGFLNGAIGVAAPLLGGLFGGSIGAALGQSSVGPLQDMVDAGGQIPPEAWGFGAGDGTVPGSGTGEQNQPQPDPSWTPQQLARWIESMRNYRAPGEMKAPE